MAKKRGTILNSLRQLNGVTRSTNSQTYGIGNDPTITLRKSVDDYMDYIKKENPNIKNIVNSTVTKKKLGSMRDENIANLYDIVNQQDIINSVQSMIGRDNAKFTQMLKDYEMVKRCLPQVHKVITSLRNNIISPDAMATTAICVELPTNTSNSEREKIMSLIDTYNLNDKLQEWVMDYLIASVKYVVPTPFSQIPDLLEKPEGAYKKSTLNESVSAIDEHISILSEDVGTVKTLKDYVGPIGKTVINETITIPYQPYQETSDGELSTKEKELEISPGELTEAVNIALENIEIVKGGAEYFKKATLNEAVIVSKTLNDDLSMDKELRSIKRNLKKSKDNSIYSTFNDEDNYGYVDDKIVDKIREHVSFRGCHLETLPASKVVRFDLRGVTVCYFYVEDRYSVEDGSVKAQTIIDKINASVYMQNNNQSKILKAENAIIRAIGDKLIDCIDHRFINDNYDDLDIIYQFVKDNALHRDKKRVVFLHPDDVCEFRRSDGSIMKNCMFYAKLYILTLLSNVLANVTRGADRQLYYVKTGLTTDIEGSVNHTIRAIKQNQIRASDLGTVNDIFNIVGSNVDIFMPRSIDGETPIETETISGQNVDMNNEFLQWLMKSIVQSFGVPSGVVDDFDNMEFAKQISTSNIDVAKACLDAQTEISPTLTKLFRLIVHYELPEYTDWESIRCYLNPPSVIMFETNRERVDSVAAMAEMLAPILVEPMDEQFEDKVARIFKLNYMKANLPTINWDDIEEFARRARILAKEEMLKREPDPMDDPLAGGNGAL